MTRARRTSAATLAAVIAASASLALSGCGGSATDHAGHHGGASKAAERDMAGMDGHAMALGLTSEAHGLRLEMDDEVPAAGRQQLTFRILEGDEPVRDLRTVHERKLHLIIAGSGDRAWEFDHVHPEPGSDGTWSVFVDLEPGQHRAYADFTPTGGDAVVLGHELSVPGTSRAGLLPSARTADVDGLEVMLSTKVTRRCKDAPGTPLEAMLSYAVGDTTTGRAAALEPYLGEFGHTVILREDDRSYLHAHPSKADGAARGVAMFHAKVQPGTMRVFFDFKVDGKVHSAPFRVEVAQPPACTGASGHMHGGDAGHGDMDM